MLERIDTTAGLYVLRYESGYSCLGFKVAHDWAMATAKWLGEAPPAAPMGTAEAYSEYESIMAKGEAHSRRTGTRDPSGLSPQLTGLEGKRVEVVSLYGERRRFKVGKSTGWRPCHLELANARSTGGGAAEVAYKSVRLIG